MKTDHLVNGYVLTNLFYELIFLDDHGLKGTAADWATPHFVDDVIRRFVVTRFHEFKAETRTVVRNTLRYLLATESDTSELWETIWEASSAPIPTPNGVRDFIKRCYEILFDGEPLPSREELANFTVSHDMHISNLLH
jgi:hypothetical protein